MTQPAYTDADWCAFVDAYRDVTGNVPREKTVSAILDAVAPAIAARAAAEALREEARRLHLATEGASRIGTRNWPEAHRDTYTLAIEEARGVLRRHADEIEAGR